MKIVISGAIGSGKSTVVRHVKNRVNWPQPNGYFVVKESSALTMETWRGERRVCAVKHDRKQPDRPPYNVDLALFNGFAADTLMGAPDALPVVIDELGILEIPAERFTRTIAALFQQPRPVLAVIQQRVLDAWLKIIGRECVDHLFIVNRTTREALPGQIAALF